MSVSDEDASSLFGDAPLGIPDEDFDNNGIDFDSDLLEANCNVAFGEAENQEVGQYPGWSTHLETELSPRQVPGNRTPAAATIAQPVVAGYNGLTLPPPPPAPAKPSSIDSVTTDPILSSILAVNMGLLQPANLGPRIEQQPGQIGHPSFMPMPLPPIRRPAVVPHVKPPPPPGVKVRNKRGRKDSQLDRYHFYDPLPRQEDTEHVRYQSTGEFSWNISFDETLFLEYIQSRLARGLPLGLWIQNPPAHHNCRFISGPTSHKCRMKDCPATHHTIGRGFLQVSIDENPEGTGICYDPFHCAGFMHLSCFERMINFPGLMHRFPDLIRLDNRILQKEAKNPMSLDRDGTFYELDAVCYQWKQDQINAPLSQGRRPKQARQYKDTLSSYLTETIVRLQAPARQQARDKRGGCDIAKHKGNIGKYVRMKTEAREKRRLQRRQQEDDEEDDDEDDDDDDDVQVASQPRQKRRKVSHAYVHQPPVFPINPGLPLQHMTYASGFPGPANYISQADVLAFANGMYGMPGAAAQHAYPLRVTPSRRASEQRRQAEAAALSIGGLPQPGANGLPLLSGAGTADSAWADLTALAPLPDSPRRVTRSMSGALPPHGGAAATPRRASSILKEMVRIVAEQEVERLEDAREHTRLRGSISAKNHLRELASREVRRIERAERRGRRHRFQRSSV